jgi:hypothetical protein
MRLKAEIEVSHNEKFDVMATKIDGNSSYNNKMG